MKHIEKIQDIEGVLAVYTYTLPQGVIPLVIVNKKVDWEILKQARDRSDGCIVLTKKDIQTGKDVFALRFLHMQAHASLLYGKDVLKKIEIKQEHARRALEGMLRVMLIDMREYLLVGSLEPGVIDRIALTLDRLTAYGHVLQGKHKTWTKHVASCVELCAKKHVTYDDLLQVYTLLEKMTKYIDRL